MEEDLFSSEDPTDETDTALKNSIASILEKSLEDGETLNSSTLSMEKVSSSNSTKPLTPRKEVQEKGNDQPCSVALTTEDAYSTCVDPLKLKNVPSSLDGQPKQKSDQNEVAVEEDHQSSDQDEALQMDHKAPQTVSNDPKINNCDESPEDSVIIHEQKKISRNDKNCNECSESNLRTSGQTEVPSNQNNCHECSEDDQGAQGQSRNPGKEKNFDSSEDIQQIPEQSRTPSKEKNSYDCSEGNQQTQAQSRTPMKEKNCDECSEENQIIQGTPRKENDCDKSCADDWVIQGKNRTPRKCDGDYFDIPSSEDYNPSQKEIAPTYGESSDNACSSRVLSADVSTITNITHSSGENPPSQRKKRERSPVKVVDSAQEHGSSDENEVLSARKKLRIPIKLEQSLDQSKLFDEKNEHRQHKSQLNKNGGKKRRGRPPKFVPVKLNFIGQSFESAKPKETPILSQKSKLHQKNVSKLNQKDTFNLTKGKKGSIDKTVEKKPVQLYRYPRHQSIDEETVSFFLPEDWFFVGSIRQGGKNAGHVDMYYWTPPPRVKLRSRLELLAYMNANDLKYDPLMFFIRQHVPILLKKGILKYYDSKSIIHASSDESLAAQVISYSSRGMGNANKKKEAKIDVFAGKTTENDFVKACPKQKRIRLVPLKQYLAKKLKSTLSVKTFLKLGGVPLTKKTQAQSPEILPEKTRERSLSISTKPQASSTEGEGTKPRCKNWSTPVVKSELAFPESANRRLRDRISTDAAPKSQAPSPLATNTSSREEDLSPPRKKPGRPRKSVTTAIPDVPPAQSNAIVEEPVRIRSKPKIVQSPYFSSIMSSIEKPKSPAGLRRERTGSFSPPRSPFNLIQEDLFHDPWQMLIATIFLNSTSGRVAIPLALEFLKRWPTPQQACQAKLYDILDVIEPLGFGRTRAAIIIRFSHEFLTKDWKLPNELYGIGKYGTDSFKIFCMKNAWKKVESDDPMLMMYLNWRRATEHLRKRFLKTPPSKVPDKVTSSISSSVNSLQAANGAEDKPSPSPRKRLRTRTK